MDIQGLKDKILQLAIQGKLVEQDKNDEPASVLLERIKEERDKLVKEKKIRKPKKLPPIEEGEKPFDVPEGWEWVRINDICNVKGGKRIPKGYNFSDEKTEYVYLRVTDMKCRTILDDDIRYINEEVYNMIKNYTISSDDLYITIAGTIGAVGKIPSKYNNMNLTENASKLSFYKKSECSLDYIMYSIESNLVQNQFKNKVNKMAQPKLALREIESTVIPLPPLAEQKRIVEKVDELFALIDELDSNKEDLLEVINLTRNQVLQEAIQGKLVEQNPEDEPASLLLERIKEERDKLVKEGKIKKQKPLPEITEEEKPFKLPEGWEWVRLGEVAQFINGDRGKNYPSKNELVERGIPFVNAGHLNNSEIELDNMNYITDKKFESLSSGKIQIKDIIYCLRGTLGKCSINKKIEKGAIASSLVIIRSYINIYEKYLYYYLVSPLAKYMIKKYDNGTAQPNLSAESVRQYSLPLPPLAEQKRIVEKVDEIMNMLDELENKIVINI